MVAWLDCGRHEAATQVDRADAGTCGFALLLQILQYRLYFTRDLGWL